MLAIEAVADHIKFGSFLWSNLWKFNKRDKPGRNCFETCASIFPWEKSYLVHKVMIVLCLLQ